MNFDRTQQLLHNHLPCALLDNLTSLRRVLLPQLDGPMPAFGTSLALQLLKKGNTGLVVGNARGNICLISGDKRVVTAVDLQKTLMFVPTSVWSSNRRGAVASCSREGAFLPLSAFLLFSLAFVLCGSYFVVAVSMTLWWPVPRLLEFKPRKTRIGKTMSAVPQTARCWCHW